MGAVRAFVGWTHLIPAEMTLLHALEPQHGAHSHGVIDTLFARAAPWLSLCWRDR